MLIESENFLDLDNNNVSKILASSSLQINSEVEVYNAANKWLSHNIEDRSKFARKLLLKVRLNLLSEQCLKYLINEFSCISNNNDCFEVMKNRVSFYQNVSTVHNKNRECNQDMFNVLFFGGRYKKAKKSTKQVKILNRNNFDQLKDSPSMLEERHCHKEVFLKEEVYVFSGLSSKKKYLKSVEKYSPVTKTWSYVCDLPDKRQGFCACAFMDHIYLFGGYASMFVKLNSCLKFDAKTSKSKELAKMSETKSHTACAIYEEKIVVSGGFYQFPLYSNTVESYDVFRDT